MKRIIMLMIAAFAATCFIQAQQTPATEAPKPSNDFKKENIIIRKKGDSKEKLTIVIDGDKVTVNGKPAEDFKSDDIEIISSDGLDDIAPFPPTPPMLLRGGTKTFNRNFSNDFNFNFESNRAMLGVMIDNNDNNKGAKIKSITKQSAAEKAGLKEGDVITKIGDKTVEDASDVTNAIRKYKPEDKVTVTYLRDGKSNTATATLDKNKNKNFNWSDNDDAFSIGGSDSSPFIAWAGRPRLGIQVQDTDDSNGVTITDVNDDESPAAKAGLKEDDVITSVNGKNITSVDDLKTAVKNAKEGDTLKLQYKRNNQLQSADVKFPKRLKRSDL